MNRQDAGPQGIYAALELVAADPGDAATYYEWLLELQSGVEPGDALRGVGVFDVRRPRDDESSGWVPAFAPDDPERAFATARARGGVVERIDDPRAVLLGYLSDSGGARSGILDPRTPVRGPGRGAYWSSNVDLSAVDLDRSTAFYADVFDRPVLAVRDDPYDMRFVVDDVYPVLGVFHVPGLASASRGGEWFVYFEVPDLVRATARAIESGSRLLVPPSRSPFNDFALLDDPWGSVFGISTLRTDTAHEEHALVDAEGRTHDLRERLRLRPPLGDRVGVEPPTA